MAAGLLLAEDNSINRKVALAMLSGVGYQVDSVYDGAGAVRPESNLYDAILMDCQMPGMNGYEATAAIRHREGSRQAHPDHCPDGRGPHPGQGAVPERRHGRVPRQADQQRCAALGGRLVRANHLHRRRAGTRLGARPPGNLGCTP